VVSRRLGISGQCDIVEFHTNGEVIPVEYKRGKPKTNDTDRVQLCAQAMCLEEMLLSRSTRDYCSTVSANEER
jgi:CRISPR-associated exonuclease Cas4